jgi:hypothetical protein
LRQQGEGAQGVHVLRVVKQAKRCLDFAGANAEPGLKPIVGDRENGAAAKAGFPWRLPGYAFPFRTVKFVRSIESGTAVRDEVRGTFYGGNVAREARCGGSCIPNLAKSQQSG